jgi:hypothetical protein
MPNDREIFIYALIDPRNGAVRYVGQTVSIPRRVISHRRHALETTKTHKAAWIRSLLDAGYEPQIVVLETTTVEGKDQAEKKWIQHYRDAGANLTNLTDGGEGTPGGNIGNQNWKLRTPEGNQRIGDAHRGKVESEETRLKKSLAHRGKPSGMAGHKHSDETKARIGASVRKNRWGN